MASRGQNNSENYRKSRFSPKYNENRNITHSAFIRYQSRIAQTSRKVLIICIINKKINQCAVKKTDITP